MKENRLPQVNFIYDRYKKASPNRKAAVELRITHDYKQRYISTGVMLYPNQWKKGAIVNCPDIIQTSKILETMITKVRQIILDMAENNAIDITAIPRLLQKVDSGSTTFLDYCKQRATVRKYGKAARSQLRYDIFLHHFEKWGGIIDFTDVNEKNIIKYDKYMCRMKPVSRWGNYHKFLNLFILDAINAGLLQRNPYKWVNIDKGKSSMGLERCLTPEEFRRLKTAPIPTQSMERVRDLFVFQTYTCLSYSDLKEFDSRMIQEVKGMSVYVGQRKKTNHAFTIPLLSPALGILHKYQGKLPVISNVKYNLYLKNIAQAAGIDKPISSHWARHTGATLLLNEGVPMQIVSKICGHSSTKITEQVYAKLLDETVVDAIKDVTL